MKRFILILGLSLMSYSSFAGTNYEVGAENCQNFEDIEQAYQEQLATDQGPSVSVTLFYSLCLLLKGKTENNRAEINKGLDLLHDPAHIDSNVVANFFLAEYHGTGGTFLDTPDYNLEEAVEYYNRTLAIIKTYSHYPPPQYMLWEKRRSMELEAYYKLPRVYLGMFFVGFIGDYNIKLLASPSYEGNRKGKTYPEYNQNIVHNIDRMITHAGNCKEIKIKSHFEKDVASVYKKICGVYYEKAKALKSIHEEFHVLLSQKRCNDIGSDEMVFANCPEIDRLMEEFYSTYDSIFDERDVIFEPLGDRVK